MANGHKATIHLALEDATGDSAIIEYINGRAMIHHGKDYRVVTNDPTYDEQLALLGKLNLSKPSSDLPIPGNVSAVDRFQRASYYLKLLPEPINERQTVAGALAIARNVSVPFGAPYKDFGVYNTEYRTVADLTNKRYFFELSDSPGIVWVDLKKVNFAAGAPVQTFDPRKNNATGNITSLLSRMPAPF